MANTHTKEQQAFIVRKLAAFEEHNAITRDFVAVYPDTKCSADDVRRLEPSNGLLPDDLRAVFLKERERIILDPAAAPFAALAAQKIALSADIVALRANNEVAQSRVVMRQLAELCGFTGPKGAPAKGGPADDNHLPVGKIVREFVEPKPAKEENEQTDA